MSALEPAPRILFVIPGAAQGNSMIFARRQAEALRANGVQVETFFLRSRTSVFVLLAEWQRYRKVAAAFQPQVVHGQFGTMTALFTVLAAWPVPIVITYRGSDLNPVPRSRNLRAGLGRAMSQVAALGASRLVCVSRGLRDRLWWRRQIANILPSGVDLEKFCPQPRESARKELGWPASGYVVLFNAGAEGENGNKRLDLALDTVTLARRFLASDRCAELRLEILRGNVLPDRMPLLMNAADCLLITSDAEGSPSVVQEALASNLPVVSVAVGDVAERLEGVPGTRIVPRDPAALARAVVKLIQEPRPSGGRLKAQECSSRYVAGELVRIYREAARNSPWNTSHF